jgi:hypothetical protein
MSPIPDCRKFILLKKIWCSVTEGRSQDPYLEVFLRTVGSNQTDRLVNGSAILGRSIENNFVVLSRRASPTTLIYREAFFANRGRIKQIAWFMTSPCLAESAVYDF